MKFNVRLPDVRRNVARERTQFQRDLRQAKIIATDRASREGQEAQRTKMRAMKLGKLGNAVGQTSMLRKPGKGDPYGVIYAKGGDRSRAGGALEAYSRGALIEPEDGGKWLWMATDAIPRKIGRKRTTPELFRKSGLMGSIGKLEFRPIGPDRALYVIKRVSLQPKTGRAKALGPRATRSRVIPQRGEVVAFVGIRKTHRAQRYDKDRTVFPFAMRQPRYVAEAMARLQAARRS